MKKSIFLMFAAFVMHAAPSYGQKPKISVDFQTPYNLIRMFGTREKQHHYIEKHVFSYNGRMLAAVHDTPSTWDFIQMRVPGRTDGKYIMLYRQGLISYRFATSKAIWHEDDSTEVADFFATLNSLSESTVKK